MEIVAEAGGRGMQPPFWQEELIGVGNSRKGLSSLQAGDLPTSDPPPAAGDRRSPALTGRGLGRKGGVSLIGGGEWEEQFRSMLGSGIHSEGSRE